MKSLHFKGSCLFLLLIYLVIPIGQINNIFTHCTHAVDFSIYQQAIGEIANTGNLNPYLTVRDMKIFNDHFDPIILLAAPFVKLFNYWPGSYFLFEYLFFTALIALTLFYCKHLTLNQRLSAVLMILFTKGILSGLNFPIHPTTWIMLPGFLLPWIIERDRPKEIIGFFVLTSLFKETMPLVLMCLSLVFFKRRKLFFGLLAFCIAMNVFNFHFRGILFGETKAYAGTFSKFTNDPNFNVIDFILGQNYKAIFKMFLPFLFIYGFLIKDKKWKDPTVIKTHFFVIPVFGIQYLREEFHYQYGAQIVAPLIGLILLPKFKSVFFDNKRRLVALCLVFILTGMGSISKNVRAALRINRKNCLPTPEKRFENEQLREFVRSRIKNNETVLVTGGLVPDLYRPGMKIYQMAYFSKALDFYDYVIFERKRGGLVYPLHENDIESEFIPACKESSEGVVFESEYFIVFHQVGGRCIELVEKRRVHF
ncbi:MAG: DUF2079 domain-containing protein [Bacteriovoracaceae bacterium]